MDVVKEVKRKRGEHTSKACESCKYRHKKCDGQTPCQRCTDAGNECIYTANSQKRGPGDKIKRLQEKIDQLEEEVKRANGLNMQLHSNIFIPYHHVVEQTQSTDIILNGPIESKIFQPVQTSLVSTTIKEDNDSQKSQYAPTLSPLSPSFEVSTCITHYLNRFGDFRGIKLPQVDMYNFINDEGDLRQNLLLSSALASMASHVGHPSNAQSFLHKAKTLMSMYFDSTHTDVAYSHSFMANTYAALCKIHESELHNGIAMTMINSLMRKPEIASDDQQISPMSSIFADILFRTLTTAFSRNAFKKAIDEFIRFCKNAKFQDRSWTDFMLPIMKLWFYLLDGNNDKLMLMGLIDEAAMMIPNDVDQMPIFNIVLNTSKASFYFYFGNNTLATKLSDQVLDSIEKNKESFSHGAAFILTAIGQIYLVQGCSVQYQRTVELLTELIPHFPIAETCARLLVSPHSIDNNDLVMTIPVFGRRFKSDDDNDFCLSIVTCNNDANITNTTAECVVPSLPQETLSPGCSSSSGDDFSNLSSPQLLSLVDINFLDDFV